MCGRLLTLHPRTHQRYLPEMQVDTTDLSLAARMRSSELMVLHCWDSHLAFGRSRQGRLNGVYPRAPSLRHLNTTTTKQQRRFSDTQGIARYPRDIEKSNRNLQWSQPAPQDRRGNGGSATCRRLDSPACCTASKRPKVG
jgi:hypothetical protein